MAGQQSQVYNLALDERERKELVHALEQCVTETHDEKCHADSFEHRAEVASDESRLRTLLERVSRLDQDGQERAAVIQQATPGMAEQIARAARVFEFERTGRMPKSVSVVLGQDTIVITIHEALSPAERAMAQSPSGAAQVQELHRRLFDNSSDALRKEIKRITGVEVSEAGIEVEPTTGTVVKAFTSGTVVQVFLLAHGTSTESWSGSGSDGQ
jgi:uncharacterized protein YbcI